MSTYRFGDTHKPGAPTKKFGLAALKHWVFYENVAPPPLMVFAIIGAAIAVGIPLLAAVVTFFIWLGAQSKAAQLTAAAILLLTPSFVVVFMAWRRHRRWVVEETIDQFDKSM